MINRKLTDITIEDLQLLIDNEIGEGRSLEYKSELQIDTGDKRKEFLADISSFANSEGGDLIFGINEDKETKLPREICGITINSMDELKQQIENLVRDSVQPRITDIQFHQVKIANSNYVLIVRIPASIFAPHRVNYNKHGHFYARNSSGKYQMDVSELRRAFNQNQELSDNMERYKIERLMNATANRYGWLSKGYPVFALLALPVTSFLRGNNYPISEIQNAIRKVNMSVFNGAYISQITVDGIRLARNDAGNEDVYGHFSVKGICECYATFFFRPSHKSTSISTSSSHMNLNLIMHDVMAKDVRHQIQYILEYYSELNIEPPIYISCAIMNGQGFTFPKNDLMSKPPGEIDRDLLLTSDILIDTLSAPVDTYAKPILDSIWNACGYRGCEKYDAHGVYRGLV